MHAVHTTRMSFGAAVKTQDPSRLLVSLYTIAVEQSDPAEIETKEIVTALQGLVAQLDGRQLEVMLPGSAPTLAGIAAWAIEQLALNFPRLTAVTMSIGSPSDGDAVRIEREVNR